MFVVVCPDGVDEARLENRFRYRANRAFVGARLDEEFAGLATRHVATTERGSLLREISEQVWVGA